MDMQNKIKSEGKCYFCGKAFAKAGINRHLKTHLEGKGFENKEGTSFLLKVEPDTRYGGFPYFLSLWVDGSSTMKKLDAFLREIWLECCGHMSAFRNPVARQNGAMWDFFEAQELLASGKTKQYEELMEQTAGEIPMSRKARDVFHQDFKLEYEYDFGSTTQLVINVLAEYPFKADKPIILLSRNEPLEIFCESCGKQPATQICTAHGWNEESMFCEKCAKKHAKICSDFEDYAALPVVNSPRMGVCGYAGGTIDIERDGSFVKK